MLPTTNARWKPAVSACATGACAASRAWVRLLAIAVKIASLSAADLLGGVQQRRGQPGFVDRYAGVGGGRDADEHGADPDREDQHSG